jgi:cation transporter-like permease
MNEQGIPLSAEAELKQAIEAEPQQAMEPKTKLTASVKEKWLVPLALLVAALFDRLVMNPLFGDGFLQGAGAFWLCYLAGFYAVYWQRMKKEKLLWFIAACAAALCAWNFIFDLDANWQYSAITFFVIPGVLMLHAQMGSMKKEDQGTHMRATEKYHLKRTGQITAAWFSGWFLKPFTGLPAMGRVTGSLVSGDGKKDTARKSAFGILLALLLLCIIIPLLSGADKVFGYYMSQILADFNIASLFWHSLVIIIAFMLFYSFLWNVGFGEKGQIHEGAGYLIDRIISGIVLGTVCAVYIIFCAVQFSYLFAGAGLPNGMTYSAYAREGFAQTVVVCALNLLIFGIFLRYGNHDRDRFRRRNRTLDGERGGDRNHTLDSELGGNRNHRNEGKALQCLLAMLLGLTAIMLVSGGVRLHLYIDAYGLTWLRLLSGWFIVYLIAVVLLCAARMYLPGIPLIAICAMVLLGWYVILGYANPDALAGWYNDRFGYDVVAGIHHLRVK